MKPSSARNTGVVTTVEENGWAYVKDGFGDWRGTNTAGTQRSRLKGTLEWARADVKSRRLQRLIRGTWIDDIR